MPSPPSLTMLQACGLCTIAEADNSSIRPDGLETTRASADGQHPAIERWLKLMDTAWGTGVFAGFAEPDWMPLRSATLGLHHTPRAAALHSVGAAAVCRACSRHPAAGRMATSRGLPPAIFKNSRLAALFDRFLESSHSTPIVSKQYLHIILGLFDVLHLRLLAQRAELSHTS
jgi:hypothetical protein